MLPVAKVLNASSFASHWNIGFIEADNGRAMVIVLKKINHKTDMIR